MKKFYPLILTAVLVFFSLAIQAQTTYTSILDNSTTNYTLDDSLFWQSHKPPPNPCTNCRIFINTTVTMVPDDGTTSATGYSSPGTPALNDVVLNDCILTISGGVTLTINTYVQLFNSSLLVGSDATTPATVILNDQADLNGSSVIQLANLGCVINANNDIGHLVVGPHTPLNFPASEGQFAGIYAIYVPAEVSQVLIGSSYQQGRGLHSFTPYTLNCDGNDADKLDVNGCTTGVVYGPAVTGMDTNPLTNYGIIFQSAFTLPVNLVQFLGSKSPDGSIKLSWATAQEVNAGYFDVERSSDQGAWTKIGSVKAKGNSSTATNYTLTDETPMDGVNYYRLKMVDLDAKYQYSKTLAVGSDNNQALVVYSNPFTDAIRVKVNLSRAQNLSLVVSDLVGRTYVRQSYNGQAGDNLIDLVPAGATDGMYVLHIEGSTYSQTIKLVKQ